jgi:ribosomal protein S14
MKDEAMKLALEALKNAHSCTAQEYDNAIKALEEALAQPAPVQEPVAWHDKIMGMEVSMDVSTGEDDIDHRIYGTVYEVILKDDGGTPDVILAIESERNFTTPPAQPAPLGCDFCTHPLYSGTKCKNCGREPAPVQEPFGYFKVEPFGWTDCIETDEGAIALYEHPAAPVQERNFCPRCGKRTRDLTTIHTCTPPQEQA